MHSRCGNTQYDLDGGALGLSVKEAGPDTHSILTCAQLDITQTSTGLTI